MIKAGQTTVRHSQVKIAHIKSWKHTRLLEGWMSNQTWQWKIHENPPFTNEAPIKTSSDGGDPIYFPRPGLLCCIARACAWKAQGAAAQTDPKNICDGCNIY